VILLIKTPDFGPTWFILDIVGSMLALTFAVRVKSQLRHRAVRKMMRQASQPKSASVSQATTVNKTGARIAVSLDKLHAADCA
jgi:hypothetical protein